MENFMKIMFSKIKITTTKVEKQERMDRRTNHMQAK